MRIGRNTKCDPFIPVALKDNLLRCKCCNSEPGTHFEHKDIVNYRIFCSCGTNAESDDCWELSAQIWNMINRRSGDQC
jgi:hypothetical protein